MLRKISIVAATAAIIACAGCGPTGSSGSSSSPVSQEIQSAASALRDEGVAVGQIIEDLEEDFPGADYIILYIVAALFG